MASFPSRAPRALLPVLPLVALLLAACGSVDSVHPLAGPGETTLDEGLVGYWLVEEEGEADDEEGGGEPSVPGDPPARPPVPKVIVVGRAARDGVDGPTTGPGGDVLQACAVGLDEGGRVEVLRLAMEGTSVAGRSYLSVRVPADPPRWTFLRYELEGEDRLWVHGMDVAYVARAVLAGKIAGTVDGEGEDLATRQVHLTADTAALRAFVAAHADEAFRRADRPLLRLERPPPLPSGGASR